MINDDKAFDRRFFSAYIWKKLGVIREDKGITIADLASRIWNSSGNVSNILNGKIAVSIDQIWKVAQALWLSEKEFDKLTLAAKEADIERSHGVKVKVDNWEDCEIDEEYALKSLIGNNPAAQEEAKSVIKWIKQKYWLK